MTVRSITLPTRIVTFDEETEDLECFLPSGERSIKVSGGSAISMAVYLETALRDHGEVVADYLLFGIELGLVHANLSGVRVVADSKVPDSLMELVKKSKAAGKA